MNYYIRTYLFICALFVVYQCDSPASNSNDITFNNMYFDFDKETGKIFLQLDALNSTAYNIDSVYVKMEYANNPSAFSKIFFLNDSGSNGDQISDNGIYSLLSDELELTSAPQEIYTVNMPDVFLLDTSETDTLYIDLFVSGEIYNLVYGVQLNNGVSYEESKSVNLDNARIQYYIDRDLMCIDNASTDVCDRECVIDDSGNILEINSAGYSTDDTWIIDKYSDVIGSYLRYSTSIPMRPVDECGGTGYALFRFDIENLDSEEVYSVSDYQLMISGCGDDWCSPNIEDYENCPQDCDE